MVGTLALLKRSEVLGELAELRDYVMIDQALEKLIARERPVFHNAPHFVFDELLCFPTQRVRLLKHLFLLLYLF